MELGSNSVYLSANILSLIIIAVGYKPISAFSSSADHTKYYFQTN